MAKHQELTREQRGPTVFIAGLEITPIERVSIRVFEVAGQLVGWSEKRPIALVLRSADREWRLELPVSEDPDSQDPD